MSLAAAACLQRSAEGDWLLAGWCGATGPHMTEFSSWRSALTPAAGGRWRVRAPAKDVQGGIARQLGAGALSSPG